MIGTIDIRVNAAKPNFPLSPFYAFINSPSQVRVVNVPRSIGDWEITAVYVTANYPDNTSQSVACTLTGGCWHATLAASTATGTSTNGFTITANGVKEDGTTAVTGYVLGKGDLAILDTDGQITVGSTTYYIHLLDSVPTTPHKGDVCLIDSAWKIYDGSQWIGFGSSGGDVCHSDFASVNAISDRFTIADVKEKVNTMLNILKGTTASVVLTLAALSAALPSSAAIEAQSARLDALYNDDLVVTNVTGAATDPGVVSNIVEAYGYATTNAAERISANSVTNNVATWAMAGKSAPITDLSPATNYVNSVITNTCPAFSNAVLTVGLGISTNEVASIKAMVDSFSDYPIGTGATTIGALLLALAGAVTWLKKHTVKTDGETTQSVSGELIVGDLNVVGGTKFEIVSSVPSSPASDTLYFITGS